MQRSRRLSGPLDIWAVIIIVAAGATLMWLSIRRYTAYNAGMMDLGNMSQAIWSATQGRPLECTYVEGNLSRLAHHVEIIYFLLAPVYALFPSAVTLLIVQALLYAAAGFPLFALAYRRLQHRWAARLIVMIYLLYPVAQAAVLFDFHGDTLAMPLLIFAFDALDRRVHWSYGLWVVLALTCKFYVSVPVAVYGLVLWVSGERRVGACTASAGALWFLVTNFVIRPHFAPVSYVPPEATAAGYIGVYFGQLRELFTSPGLLLPRLLTAGIVFAPGLWLGRRAFRWLAPAAAVALPALVAGGLVAAYDYRFHHYALVVPFVVLASLEGAVRLRQRAPGHWHYDVAMQAAIVVLFAALLVDTPVNPLFWTSPPGWGNDPRAYGATSRDAMKGRWLERVPDRAPIMASFFLAPHVANRSVLFLPQIRDYVDEGAAQALLDQRLGSVDYVVLDALFDYVAPSMVPPTSDSGIAFISRSALGGGHPEPVVGGVLYDSEAIKAVLSRSDFALVSAQDGLLLFRRRDVTSVDVEWEELLLTQSVEVETVAEPPHLAASFGDVIGLVETSVTPVAGDRYRLRYTWLALDDPGSADPWFAVTELDGVDDARILHVPTIALYPTTEWRQGEVIVEEFEVDLLDHVAPGAYALRVGWYDSGHVHAYATDERSRIDTLVDVGTLQVND